MAEKKTVLVLGGGSDMGCAIAAEYAAKGWRIVLAARADHAARNAGDLEIRHGAEVSTAAFDVLDLAGHGAFLDRLGVVPDTIVSVIGYMGDQARDESDMAHAATVLRSNFEGPALILAECANRMAVRGTGTIVGVSSVAGDRGRASNYIYGAGKAGLTAFLSGLRGRMSHHGVHVLTVKPGFVRTAMTAHLKLPAALTAAPEEVGKAVYKAAEVKKKNEIYVRPIWSLVMMIIKSIPESLFKKMKI